MPAGSSGSGGGAPGGAPSGARQAALAARRPHNQRACRLRGRRREAVPPPEDRGSGRAPHDARNSLAKTAAGRAGRPRSAGMPGFLAWPPRLSCRSTASCRTAYAGEMAFRIGGIGHAACSIEDRGAPLWSAPQPGGLEGTHGAGRMHGMGVRTRGFVPQAVGAGGAMSPVGAHDCVMRGGGSDGPKPPHLRHIHGRRHERQHGGGGKESHSSALGA